MGARLHDCCADGSDATAARLQVIDLTGNRDLTFQLTKGEPSAAGKLYSTQARVVAMNAAAAGAGGMHEGVFHGRLGAGISVVLAITVSLGQGAHMPVAVNNACLKFFHIQCMMA